MSASPSDRLRTAPHPAGAPPHGSGHAHDPHPEGGRRRRSELERFRQAAELLHDELLLVDGNGCIAYANPAALAGVGESGAGLAGVRLRAWLGDGRDLVEVLARDGAPAGPVELAMRHRDGRLLLKEVSFSPLPADGRRLWCMIGRDLGARRAAEEERRRLDELMRRSDRLDRLGVLTGGIAHDVNNLLTGMLGGITLARRRQEAGEAAAAASLLGQAERAALRAAALLRQLLGASRGGEPARRTTGGLAELVGDAAELAARGSAVRCRIDAQPGLWPAEVDGGEIAQVVQNLVINAVQASRPGSEVRLALRNRELAGGGADPAPPGRYCELLVADHGCGIAAEDLARIFDPWFTTKPAGSGIGLATCRAIVERHYGRIAVESEPGVGTVFTVLLPAAACQPAPAEAAPAAAPPGGGRALVMDDDATVRAIAVDLLVALGWSVDAVADGAAAVAAVRTAAAAGRSYDLALLDLTVPGGLGGLATMPLVRAADGAVMGVLSSGHAPELVEEQARSAGFAALLPKPYTAAEFAAAVAAALAARP
ncbi:MAG: ATP-binding protein [Planctomycetes bacterium]|nr:ATP-binding protein [Planctomycetota bacterium]